MGGNRFFDNGITETSMPIPIDDLHSPFDHENNMTMCGPKTDCGCYNTSTRYEHEHYAPSFRETHYLCPDHYAKHLEERGRQRRNEITDSCTDVTFFLAKDNQEVMSNAIKNLTLPYLKDLKEFCAKTISHTNNYSHTNI